MPDIVIRRTLDSDTLHLPELAPLIGKAVEIVVREEPVRAGSEADWSAFFSDGPDDQLDPDLYRRYRDFDRNHGQPPEL
jgi:hypothetical protein